VVRTKMAIWTFHPLAKQSPEDRFLIIHNNVCPWPTLPRSKALSATNRNMTAHGWNTRAGGHLAEVPGIDPITG